MAKNSKEQPKNTKKTPKIAKISFKSGKLFTNWSHWLNPFLISKKYT